MILVERSRMSRIDELSRRNRLFHRKVFARENSRNNRGCSLEDLFLNTQTLPEPTGPIMQIKSPGWASNWIFFSANVPF